MECEDYIDDVDKMLRCMCVRKSNDVEVEHTLDAYEDSKLEKRLMAGQGSEVELFDSIEGTGNMVSSRSGLEQFTNRCNSFNTGLG